MLGDITGTLVDVHLHNATSEETTTVVGAKVAHFDASTDFVMIESIGSDWCPPGQYPPITHDIKRLSEYVLFVSS
jgi:hypothetical protein